MGAYGLSHRYYLRAATRRSLLGAGPAVTTGARERELHAIGEHCAHKPEAGRTRAFPTAPRRKRQCRTRRPAFLQTDCNRRVAFKDATDPGAVEAHCVWLSY